MKSNKIIDFSQYREKNREPNKQEVQRKKGTVYSRNGRIWVDFRYMNERVRESSGLTDTKLNRKDVRKQLDLIIAEIENGIFEFAKRFPKSKKKKYFTALEGREIVIKPENVIFSEYVDKWWKDMKPGMSDSQIRDYSVILNAHHLPYFGDMPFSEFWSTVCLKKFLAQLKNKKNCYGEPLSGKRIRNIMIPLRVIVKDAISEYGWTDRRDPFAGLKLPKARKYRVSPFTFQEWRELMSGMPEWYQPYFEFAVQTGLRPSEQVALKWSAVETDCFHVQLSRVMSREKNDLKTEDSRRTIELRPSMKKVLQRQKAMTRHMGSSYVFMNNFGDPINQDTLRDLWKRAIKKSGIPHRRMYETRHTFASWALGAGELPEWVARTLGHVNTSMVYKTYGRYIPNLTRQDGSAFEKLYQESAQKKGGTENLDFWSQSRTQSREFNSAYSDKPLKLI